MTWLEKLQTAAGVIMIVAFEARELWRKRRRRKYDELQARRRGAGRDARGF